MQKFFAAILVFSFAAVAHAGNYPLLKTYQAQTEQAVQATAQMRSSGDVEALIQKSRQLVATGVQIMEFYASRNPVCAAQMQAFSAELGTMENRDLDEAERLFHDGEGLPQAPRHCYLGRSVVIHPVMNIIRLKGQLSDAVRAQIKEDFEEVIEHLAKIDRNLDNPPK